MTLLSDSRATTDQRRHVSALQSDNLRVGAAFDMTEIRGLKWPFAPFPIVPRWPREGWISSEDFHLLM